MTWMECLVGNGWWVILPGNPLMNSQFSVNVIGPWSPLLPPSSSLTVAFTFLIGAVTELILMFVFLSPLQPWLREPSPILNLKLWVGQKTGVFIPASGCFRSLLGVSTQSRFGCCKEEGFCFGSRLFHVNPQLEQNSAVLSDTLRNWL